MMTSTSRMPSRPGRGVALLAMLAAAAPLAAVAEPRASCPLLGAVYAAGPHRLTMELLPDGALGSAVYTL